MPGRALAGQHAILGPSDYLDIFEAPDNDTAAKVALTAALREWKGVYNCVRPRQALGYRTPWGVVQTW